MDNNNSSATAQAQPQTLTRSQMQSQSQSQSKPQAQPQSQSQSQLKPRARPQSQSQSKPRAKSEVKPQPTPQTQSQTQSKSEARPQPQWEPPKPKTTIDYAEWPRDAPSALERNIITIVCGNTRLHWALHEGCINKFIPIMFWYTVHADNNDGDDDDATADPCDVLEAHVASQAHTLIFGESSSSGPTNGANTNTKGCIRDVSSAAAKRDAPGISVFVVSSNPAMEQKICHMFRDVPAKIFKLRNKDFFSEAQGVYPTMGVDRCAALYGAKLHYGAPALVIDGGTAMTYTFLDTNSNIIGGGISPGVKVRLQSLADYTGALPTIDHQKFKSTIENAIASKKPLPFFAKDTEMAMISPVCGELACQLRNIIKQYVARCSASAGVSKENEALKKKLPVIITGGDGKFLRDLLKADASGIVVVEPDATPVQAHSIEIRHVKNLVTYALGDILYEKHSQKPRNDPAEKLLLKIQGLRIAAPAIDQKEIFSRGCIYTCMPESMIEGYLFRARFDNGSQKDLTLRELYDCLVLYNEIGEKPKGKGPAVDEDWVTEKKMWSRKVQEELGNVSRLIRNRIRQMKPHIEKGEVRKIFKRRSSIESRMRAERKKGVHPNKKARRSSSRELLGKRIAKRFAIDTVTEIPGDQIFFGTVKYVSDNLLHWFFVRYDDGDTEELNSEEIVEGIELYDVHKLNDPMHKDDVENPPQRPTVTSPPWGFPVKPKGNATSSAAATATATATYTDLSSLLVPSTGDEFPAATGVGTEHTRWISEFKEDV